MPKEEETPSCNSDLVTVLQIYDPGGYQDVIYSAQWDKVLNTEEKNQALDAIIENYGNTANYSIVDMPRAEAAKLPLVKKAGDLHRLPGIHKGYFQVHLTGVPRRLQGGKARR